MKMLEGLDEVAWTSLPQPQWNKPDGVPRSISRLAVSSTEAESQDAYSDFLFSVGNNHAGTYYPVVLATIPFLGEILKTGGELAQARTLDVLIDLISSFWPEPGYELVDTHDGVQQDLRSLLAIEVMLHSQVIRHIAVHPGRAPETQRLAGELLDTLTTWAAVPQGAP